MGFTPSAETARETRPHLRQTAIRWQDRDQNIVELVAEHPATTEQLTRTFFTGPSLETARKKAKAATIQEVPTCKVAFLEWLLGNDIANWKRMILIGWTAFLGCLAIWLLTAGVYSSTTSSLEQQNELFKQNLKAVNEREQQVRRDFEESKSRLPSSWINSPVLQSDNLRKGDERDRSQSILREKVICPLCKRTKQVALVRIDQCDVKLCHKHHGRWLR